MQCEEGSFGRKLISLAEAANRIAVSNYITIRGEKKRKQSMKVLITNIRKGRMATVCVMREDKRGRTGAVSENGILVNTQENMNRVDEDSEFALKPGSREFP